MIRQGFVSNSSSSSFILVYEEDKKLTGGKEIVEFIQENPNENIILKGQELSEGDDIFELTSSHKVEILKYPERFTANVQEIYNWEEKKYTPATAYYGKSAGLFQVPFSWDTETPNNFKETLRKDLGQDVIMKEVFIDNQSLNSDYYDEEDFKERYIIGNDLEIYKLLGDFIDDKPYKNKGYILKYKEDVTDKETILTYLKKENIKLGLCWKPPYRKGLLDDNLEVFNLGSKEKQFILDNKELLKNKNLNLLVDYDILCGVSKIEPDGYYYEARFGKVIELKNKINLLKEILL